MSVTDWDDVDEYPDEVECDWCGFVTCACDELNDAHDVEMELMYGDDD